MIDMQAEFINRQLNSSNPFMESVSYTAYGESAVSIYGIVKRNGVKSMKSTSDKMNSAYDYELIISNDADSGIETVTPRKDKVVINSPEYGEDNTFLVAGIIAHTPMCWHLGLVP